LGHLVGVLHKRKEVTAVNALKKPLTCIVEAEMTFADEFLAPLISEELAMIEALTAHFDARLNEVIHTVVQLDDLPTFARLENVGFQTARQFNKGKNRFQRLTLDRYDFIRALAELKMSEHLDLNIWQFGFDSAKRRAGLCNYTTKTITISRHLVDIHSMDESMQVVLHEIAHAMCGKSDGHNKVWLATAKSIGYRAERFTGKEIAEETATWIGLCKNGHTHYRYRQPSRPLACGLCGKGFSRANLIIWQHRDEVE
jgi:predicted SprT family Zn-dependent metalloprotease